MNRKIALLFILIGSINAYAFNAQQVNNAETIDSIIFEIAILANYLWLF